MLAIVYLGIKYRKTIKLNNVSLRYMLSAQNDEMSCSHHYLQVSMALVSFYYAIKGA